MEYTARYTSPLGEILLAADDIGLTGLWFVGQRHFARGLCQTHKGRELPVFNLACSWLDEYFSGEKPAVEVPLHFTGTTFQNTVWRQLLTIPYGSTVTYGDLARSLTPPSSPRAVGGAVGRNPISLIVPCHRVVGAGESLTGYAGGLDRKTALLALERRP